MTLHLHSSRGGLASSDLVHTGLPGDKECIEHINNEERVTKARLMVDGGGRIHGVEVRTPAVLAFTDAD